jgi:hypothetical protein
MKFRDQNLRGIYGYTKCGQRELDLLWVTTVILGVVTPNTADDYLSEFYWMVSSGRSIDYVCDCALRLVEENMTCDR